MAAAEAKRDAYARLSLLPLHTQLLHPSTRVCMQVLAGDSYGLPDGVPGVQSVHLQLCGPVHGLLRVRPASWATPAVVTAP